MRLTVLGCYGGIGGARRTTAQETIGALKKHMLNGELWPDHTVLPSAEHPYIRFVPVVPGMTTLLGKRRITPLPVRHSVPSVLAAV